MRLSSTQHFWYFFAAGILIGITIFYSFYKLSESPPTWFDEGNYLQVAHSLSESGVQAIQISPGRSVSTGHVSGGYPFLVPVALSVKFLGNSLFAARIPMAIFIIICVLAAYVVVYTLYGPRDVLLSLLLLSTFPLLYGNGKNVLGEIPGMFYTLLGLYFIWQIEKRAYKGAWWYILGGLFIGLASASKPIFFLLPVAVGIVFLLRVRSIPLYWKNIFLGALAFVMSLVVWAYLQFGGADVASSVFFHYANPYAESSLAHSVFQNALRFFKESTPLYCAALLGLWTIAVALRVYRKQKIMLAEVIAFVFSLLILAAYLRTEGWYRYFFEAMLLGLLFAPHSLRVLTEELRSHWRFSFASYLPVLLVLLGGIQFYQLNYASWVADHYASTQTQMLESYFMSPPRGSILVYDAPEIVPFLRNKNYYQYLDIDPTGVLAYGKENLPLLVAGVLDKVITTPSMYTEHAALFDRYKLADTVGGYIVLTK